MSAVVHLSGPALPGPNLRELVARVARGDQDAFSRLYDAVAGPVLGLVGRGQRAPAHSAEVAPEVVLGVWRPAAPNR
ncbi:RNA polymerase subunit sigma, partial [Kitasatospora sp. NPDC059088]